MLQKQDENGEGNARAWKGKEWAHRLSSIINGLGWGGISPSEGFETKAG